MYTVVGLGWLAFLMELPLFTQVRGGGRGMGMGGCVGRGKQAGSRGGGEG